MTCLRFHGKLVNKLGLLAVDPVVLYYQALDVRRKFITLFGIIPGALFEAG